MFGGWRRRVASPRPGEARSVSPASAAASVPAPAGQWTFNEGSGTTTADVSGNGHTGTLGAGVTWAAPEVGAHSIATNGTSAGSVSIPGAVVNTSLSYTVSAWVYLNALRHLRCHRPRRDDHRRQHRDESDRMVG
jgi:hypothetical protein